MKYLYICGTANDQKVVESDNLEKLIAMANSDWNHMCNEDRKRTVSMYVIESTNPDEDAPDHYDGEVMYDVLKEA